MNYGIKYEKMMMLAWYGPGWRCPHPVFVIDATAEIPELLWHHIVDDSGTMFDDLNHNAISYTSHDQSNLY